LYNQSAEGGHPSGITMLGYCYDENWQKAIELYQKSAYLWNEVAQYNLSIMYENGDGIIREIKRYIDIKNLSNKDIKMHKIG
jgi:TPR repeat protein